PKVVRAVADVGADVANDLPAAAEKIGRIRVRDVRLVAVVTSGGLGDLLLAKLHDAPSNLAFSRSYSARSRSASSLASAISCLPRASSHVSMTSRISCVAICLRSSSSAARCSHVSQHVYWV